MPRPSMKGKFQKPDPEVTERVRRVVETHGAVERKMFGSVSWFTPVTAQMFVCVWGDGVAVRLGEAEAAKLVAGGKADRFEPVPGHTMKEYVFIAPEEAADEAKLSAWIARSADFAMKLPPKKK